jgi:hypothetical protein
MKRNIGSFDRLIRTLLGFGLLALLFTGPQTNWGWLGLIPLFTAWIGWCPLYAMLGLSTRKTAHA